MVKKLLRHEFLYYIRNFSLFLPIILVVGIMTRVFRFLDNGSILTEIAVGSSVIMLWVSCMALMLLSTAAAVVRFYKNMYTAEGYLTFTLPVSNAQHIFVKLLVAVVCQAICLLTVVLSVVIAASGEPLAEFFLLMGEAFGELSPVVGLNMIVYALEFLLILILAAASNMLLFYACITIGQLAKKNRILLAIGAYFIYYVGTQVLSTILSILFAIFSMTPLIDALFTWAFLFPVLAIHIYLGVFLLFSAGLVALFFFITHRIMTKRLNLE